MLLQKEREEVDEYSLKASQSGLCPGTSGNLSAFHKFAGMMAITPSGIDTERSPLQPKKTPLSMTERPLGSVTELSFSQEKKE